MSAAGLLDAVLDRLHVTLISESRRIKPQIPDVQHVVQRTYISTWYQGCNCDRI